MSFFTAVTMKNFFFWDIKTQFIPHRRHISAAEPSRLMLCKVFTAVTMKHAVFRDINTSQETHYVSDTEPSRLMLCKI
jgi:hypothetical protein